MKILTWEEVLKLPANTLFKVKPKQSTATWGEEFANAVDAGRIFKKTGTLKDMGTRISCVAVNHTYKGDFYLKKFDLQNHLDIYLVYPSKPQPKLTRLELLIL